MSKNTSSCQKATKGKTFNIVSSVIVKHSNTLRNGTNLVDIRFENKHRFYTFGVFSIKLFNS